MTESYQQLVFGNVLALEKRKLLENWLRESTTGYERIRAGVPKGWVVGDKTGSGKYGTTNDVAIIWPPHCKPIVVGIYLMQHEKNAKRRPDILAAATKDILKQFAKTDVCIQEAMQSTYKTISTTKHSKTQYRLNVPGSSYRVITDIIHLKPNTLKPWHSHTGSGVGYVIKGSITITVRGQSPKTYSKGQHFKILPHVVFKAKTGSTDVTYFAVWIAQRGKENQFTTQAN